MRENTVELLELEGYNVFSAKSGDVADEILETVQIDMMFCDSIKPQSGGIDFLKRVKANKSTKEIPLIFLSEDDAPIEVRKQQELGADGYLSKPFTHKELIHTITKYSRAV